MLNLVSRYALLFVVAALIALAATGNLLSSSPVVIAAQVLAIAVAVWARRSFPPKAFRVTATPGADTVIQRGPYRLIRHPMYSAALLLIWSAVLSHLSLWTAGIAVVVTGIAAARIVLEERLLRERYPGYAAYARTTRAVVPYLL